MRRPCRHPTKSIPSCASALGFRNLVNYIARVLLETGGF